MGEIAAMQGVSQPTISKKLKRIKNFLKKFWAMAMDLAFPAARI